MAAQTNQALRVRVTTLDARNNFFYAVVAVTPGGDSTELPYDSRRWHTAAFDATYTPSEDGVYKFLIREGGGGSGHVRLAVVPFE